MDIGALRAYFSNPLHPLMTYQNAKTTKGEKLGYRTAILYLKPERSSGLGNLCPFASSGCIASCLNTAGRGRFGKIQEARQRKTELFYLDRDFFLTLLVKEIAKHVRYCERKNMVPVVRLNGTSDFPWEMYRSQLMDAFPQVVFYDYTKIVKRALSKTLPKNYKLVYSRSEVPGSDTVAKDILRNGGRVAVVFSSARFPKKYLGHKTVNGDETDLVFLQPKGSVLALKAKGKAKKDESGFVVAS